MKRLFILKVLSPILYFVCCFGIFEFVFLRIIFYFKARSVALVLVIILLLLVLSNWLIVKFEHLQIPKIRDHFRQSLLFYLLTLYGFFTLLIYTGGYKGFVLIELSILLFFSPVFVNAIFLSFLGGVFTKNGIKELFKHSDKDEFVFKTKVEK